MRKILNRNTYEKGIIGEKIASKYLINKGYSIIDRNFRKRWGEIDIIANKDSIIHFIEVKSIIDNEKTEGDIHRPEDNVSGWKIHKIRRMVETYFDEKIKDTSQNFAFHVICVYLNFVKRKARIKMIENIIL